MNEEDKAEKKDEKHKREKEEMSRKHGTNE
jgi:hypothetical protein